MRLKKRFSAGGVVFKRGREGVLRIILVSRAGGSIWCLPKGHIDAGESTEEAALREVREETGVSAEIIRKVGDIRYVFVQDGSKISKKVSFYLMRYVRGSVKDHDFEVDEARWFDLSLAVKKNSYANERELLKKAGRILSRGSA
ncbi:MAG: NUDIX hydrolase [Candidatus Omnitrophica bacterium]|nr:NUDIX hydrolase [Candidatus Omnitrophota bacterium]